jgi:Predicted pPIWI-associating nuclease
MNVHVPPRTARSSPKWKPDLPERLEAAFDAYDFKESEAYRNLGELAAVTLIEGHSIDAESTIIDGNDWITPGTIYVTLVYEPNSDDRVELNDSYPMSIYYSVDGDRVTVNRVIADTSSFYE